MNSLLFLLIIEILLLILAFFLGGQDIMSPSVVLCIMFVLSTSVALINVDTWEIQYSYKAVAILATGILTFVIGEFFYRYLWCRQLRGRLYYEKSGFASYYVRPWKLNLLVAFDLIICLWNLISILNLMGEGRTSITSNFAEYRRMGIASLASTGQSVNSGLLNQLLKIVIASGYLSSYLFVRNLVCKKSRIGEQVKYIIIMVLSVFPSMMSGGRSGILRLVSAVVIEYYIVWHQKVGWNKNLSWKYFRCGIIGLAAAIPAFYYSLRLLGRKTEETLFNYVSIYLGSSIRLFDLYIHDPVPRKIIGEESLFSVIKVLHFLGLCDASTSYNLEFRSLGMTNSNVYTFFRRPLHDFGLLGMYVFTILIAMLFSWVYYKKIKYREERKTTIWVILYGYFFYWIILSSIEQYSQTYISAGVFITICIIIVLYKVLVKYKANC